MAEENYRYRDIAVLLRNGESYYDVMRTLFTDYNIPHFIDEKRPMSHHPLVECIRSALEIISGNWRYDAVFARENRAFISIRRKKRNDA